MSLQRPLRCLLVVGCLLAILPMLPAQDDQKGPMRLRIGASPDFVERQADLTTLQVRAVQDATFYLFVQNTEAGVLKPTLTVTAGDMSRDSIQQPELATRPTSEPKEVILRPGEPAWLPTVPEKTTIKVPVRLDKDFCAGADKDANVNLHFHLFDRATGKKVDKDLNVRLLSADNLLSFSVGLTNGRFRIVVERLPEVRNFGPPCRLELDCSQLHGWNPAQSATLVNVIDQDKGTAELAVSGITSDVSGLVSVSADGIPFVKNYEVTREGSVVEVQEKNFLRIARVPSPVKPAPKEAVAAPPKTVELQFAVDRPSENARLRVAVDFTGTNTTASYETQRVFSPARKRRVCFSGAKDGGILVRPDVGPWIYSLGTEGRQGKIIVKGELIDAQENVLKSATYTIYLNVHPEITSFVVKHAPTHVEKRPGFFDPAEEVTLNAKVKSEVGVQKVSFFVGENPPQQFRRDWVVKQRNEADEYSVPMILPEAKGPLTVGVLVEDANGETSSTTTTIRIAEPSTAPGTGSKDKLGSLKGTVVQGVEDMPQAGLTVELDNGKTVVKTATTGKDGSFEMKDIPPGSYVVKCVRAIDKTKASTPVAIEPGEKKTLEKPLRLSR